MKKTFTKFLAALALLVFMMPSLAGWGQTKTETTIASWGKVSIAANTAILASGGDSNNNGTAKYISTKAMTSAGNYCYYGSSAGGAVITFSNLDLSGYEDITMTFYTRASQKGNMQISWSSNGTDYTDLNAPSITTSEAQKTSDEIPNTATHIKLAHTKTSGSLYFGTIEIKGTASSGGAAATTTTIDHSGITNTDVNTSTAAGSLSASVTSGGNAVQGASVTWSGNNDAVATINSSTGAITLHSMGTVTFTASYEGVTNQYQPSFDTYEMTVIDSQYSISNLTFTAQCNGTGTASTNDHAAWVVTSDGTESTYDPTSGIHYGTGSANVTYVQLATSDISGTIKKVVVNARDAQATATITVTVGNTPFTCTGSATATNTSADYTFTGTGSGEIVVRIDRGSSMLKAIYVKSVIVYYIPSNDPSITASDVDITHDATSGSIAYTIDNVPTPAGTLTADIKTGTTCTIENLSFGTVTNSAVPFSCASNNTTVAHTATITLTYTYGDNQTATKDITITQGADPNAISNINEITSETNYKVQGKIVAMSARGFIVGDNTGYVYYYYGDGFSTSHSINDVIKLDGTVGSYNHVYQFPAGTNITDASGSYTTPAVQVLDANGITPYSSNLHLSDYVQIQGTLTISNNTYYNVTISGLDNSASISYPTNAQATVLDNLVNKNIIVKGYFAGVSGGHFNVIMESVEEVVTPTIAVASTTINAPAAGVNGTLNVSYTAIETSTAAIVWYSDANATTTTTKPDWVTSADINQDKNVDYVIAANIGAARTAYFKVSGTSSSKITIYSDLVTINQALYVADYATLPFSFDGGRADIATTNGLTQEGLDSDYGSSPKLKFNSTGDWVILRINERPGTLTFNIAGNSYSGSTFKVQTSTDGTTYTDLATYTELSSTQSESFNNLGADVRYIKWIYTEKVSGNVALGNIVLNAYVAPVNTAPVWETLPTPTIAVNAEYELDLSTYVTGTPTPAITLATSVSSSLYEFEDGLLMFQPTAAGTYEFTFTATNSEGNASATLTVTAVEAATYTIATAITSGRHYVIAATASNVTKAMGGKNATKEYYDAIDASLNGNTITVMPNSGIQEFVIVGPNADGYYYIYDPVADGYLYASSSSSNDLNYQKPNDDNGLWEIDFTENTVTAQGTNTHNLLRYNSGSPRFSCYTSGQTAIAFYEKNETNPQYDFYVDITGYGTGLNNWYLIASPLSSNTNPTTVTNLINAEGYDLYRFNPTAISAEWENYKNTEHTDFTTLEVGRGYLYANKDNTTLHFTGTPNTSTVTLAYAGWNLIGNSSNVIKYYDYDYYIMNSDGSGIIASERTSGYVNAMEGIFVEGEVGDEITFSTSAKRANNTQVILNVINNNVIDRAIVRFNNDHKLGKLTLFDGDTKIYFSQNDADYAIVSSDGHGSMPVNFKAKEMGRYTISVETEGIDMSYLHLIDRLTGEDVNLLLDNEYSFIASNNDSEERFILSFTEKGYDAHGNEIFVYQSGNDLIVNGEGELQIFDVMGRMVKNTVINGVEAVNVPSNGVYIFKLNEMVQKIVVK